MDHGPSERLKGIEPPPDTPPLPTLAGPRGPWQYWEVPLLWAALLSFWLLPFWANSVPGQGRSLLVLDLCGVAPACSRLQDYSPA